MYSKLSNSCGTTAIYFEQKILPPCSYLIHHAYLNSSFQKILAFLRDKLLKSVILQQCTMVIECTMLIGISKFVEHHVYSIHHNYSIAQSTRTISWKLNLPITALFFTHVDTGKSRKLLSFMYICTCTVFQDQSCKFSVKVSEQAGSKLAEPNFKQK